eukprot:EG_transcript_55462
MPSPPPWLPTGCHGPCPPPGRPSRLASAVIALATILSVGLVAADDVESLYLGQHQASSTHVPVAVFATKPRTRHRAALSRRGRDDLNAPRADFPSHLNAGKAIQV